MSTYNVDYAAGSSVNTPMVIDLTTKRYTDVDTKLYMQKVGSWLYLAMHTRPDILYAVTTLSRHCKEPHSEHMTAIDRVLQYIHNTKSLGLTLHSGEGVVLYGTVDASYGCHKNPKSHTGCTMHIGKTSASIMTLTKKQSITADSSTVAEYIAAHLAAKQIMWARNFLSELGFPQKGPTILYEDNKSTISLIENDGNGSKTKHIDLRYQFIREQCRLGRIKMIHKGTENMTSDMLTKVNGTSTFLHLRPNLLGAMTSSTCTDGLVELYPYVLISDIYIYRTFVFQY